MTIIPAIDLMDGRCVRLTKGDFNTSVAYSDDPLEMARTFEKAGIGWLHMVDLDGAKTGSSHHLHVLTAVKKATNLKVDFGGGLRDQTAIRAAFDAGADQVSVGSAAIRNPDRFAGWLDEFGAERIILAADVKGVFVAVSGWAETSSTTLTEIVGQFRPHGLTYVLATDIARDGTLEGPAVDLYQDLKTIFDDVFVIASGGVGSTRDLTRLREIGCDAAIVGKAFYEGRITIGDLTTRH